MNADIKKKQLTSKLEHYRILLFSLVTIKGIKKKRKKETLAFKNMQMLKLR